MGFFCRGWGWWCVKRRLDSWFVSKVCIKRVR